METASLSGANRLFVFATLMGLAGAALWLGPIHASVRPNAAVSIPWWAELLACYVSALLVVEVGSPRRVSVSLAEVPVALGLFVVDPWVLLGCYTVGGLLAHWTRRGLRPFRDYGNLMLDVLFVGVALVVFMAVHPSSSDPLAPRSILALAAALAVAGGVLAPAALVTSVALYQGVLRRDRALAEFLTQIAGTITSACLGLIVLALAAVRPWLAAAALPPALLLIAVQHSAHAARRRAERSTFLHRVGDILERAAPLDDRVTELLGAVTGAFGAGRSELVLVVGPATAAVRYVLTGTGLQWSRAELSAAELDAINLTTEQRGFVVHAAMHGPLRGLAIDRTLDACTVIPVRGPDHTVGLLVLQQTSLSRRDLEDLAAAAAFVGGAAARGEMTPVERRRNGDTARRSRGSGPLTVHDRVSFQESITTMLLRVPTTRRPIALLLIDLDAFLGIRGTYGEAVGQSVLTDIAKRMQRHLRRYDVVGRLGTDQLGVLLDGLRNRGDAEVVGRRILDTLQRAISLNGDTITIGASVGIAVVDDFRDVPDAGELLRRADMAVYLAKRQAGMRCLVFDSDSRDSVIASTPALRR